MRFEIGLERQRQVETGEPQPDAGIGREDPGRPAAGKLELLVGGDAAERLVPAAELDDPEALGSWSRAGVESRSSSSSPSARVAGSAAGSVAEVLTTTRSPGARNSGRSPKRPWTIEPSAVRDQQAHVVSRAIAARFRRLVSLEPGAQVGRERAHRGASTRSRAR